VSYREALAWLFGTQLFGIKLGLGNIQRLLAALEVPSPDQRIIHVAGTNGKGSVCAMIDSILRAQGYRTGLFTSPHLITFRERVQVNGELIAEQQVAKGLTSIRDLTHAWDPHPTFFEIATALGLLHFQEERCDIVVFETGMGGRLDATNAIAPVVSVVTPIGLDHQKWLGQTLEEIATEKAGIIKPDIPAVSSAQLPAAAHVLQTRAQECGTSIHFVTDPYSAHVGLAGTHQKQNAALAVAALSAARIEITPGAIASGLSNTVWPARFQQWNGRIVLDGAHNPSGARILAETWKEHFGEEKAALVFGLFQDKAIREIFLEANDIIGSVHLPHFHGARVATPAEVAAIIQTVAPDKPLSLHATCGDAIEAARKTGARVLIAGSLHLAGEALAYLRGTPLAFQECDQ